jgi:hypothetical protein
MFQGHHYNWSRSACDVAFYKNMLITCQHLRYKRSFLQSFLNFWNDFASKRSQCQAAAKVYYEGVHLFADSHFDRSDHDYCLSTCADFHGNPRYNISFA